MLGGLGVGTDQQTYASDFASTRSPQLHPENLSNDVSKIPAGQDVKVRATNVGGQTILGNLTITQPDGAGYSTAYPCAEGLPVPLTSSINFAAGQTIANGVIVKSDINGDICFRGNTALHMIWDQTGETSTIATHSPVRKKDTRDNGGALLTANRALKIHASDKGSETILANLAITQPNAAGFATVYACNEGLPNPLTSSINFAAGQTIANFVIAKADSSGDVCIASNVATHIIWDQTGETNVVATHNPVRKKDTRDTNGAKVMANGDVRIHATDIGSQTIIGNLAITQPEAGGFATAYPCAEGIPVPLTSNINFVAGQTVANNVIVKADVNGDICFRPNVATHLIWDQTGETNALVTHNAVRKRDTREPYIPEGTQLISGTGEFITVSQLDPTCDLYWFPMGTPDQRIPDLPVQLVRANVNGLTPDPTPNNRADDNGDAVLGNYVHLGSPFKSILDGRVDYKGRFNANPSETRPYDYAEPLRYRGTITLERYNNTGTLTPYLRGISVIFLDIPCTLKPYPPVYGN